MLDLNRIPEALRHEGGMSRRLFMGYCAALAATPWLGSAAQGAVKSRPSFVSDPFTLGVCSGDPDSSSVVLWTRLAPKPLQPDGGMTPDAVKVNWEVAEDEAMTKVVRRGNAIAAPELAHSVHVEVDRLKPDRWYWYRFHAGDARTSVARTRTLPALATMSEELRFAVASCQHYESGYYTAYQHMAREDLDLVFHLGDYIYEGARREGSLREHANGACITLDDYRIRHAQYKTDEHLQAAHRICPWFVTWDDHEVCNNHTAETDGSPDSALENYLRRRAAAYKAYYEHMPLRARSLPRGPEMQLYRSANFGRLAELLVLDTRQFRTPQAHGGGHHPRSSASQDPRNTILGPRQKTWVKESLQRSESRWNLLAQQVMMGLVSRFDSDKGEPMYSMDQWASYEHERNELLQFMAERKVANPVVITGDIHANFVNELRVHDRHFDSPVVAAEFVGTSISSGGDGVDKPAALDRLLRNNGGLRYHNAQRGYVGCTITPDVWQSDYITVEQVTTPNSPPIKRASFLLENGRAGIQTA